ncbi:hypothetical protein JCM37173_30970 [Allocoprococcus similis]
MEKYYTVEKVAEMLSMHPKTIQRYIREGKLPAKKVGKSWRIYEWDIKNYMKDTDSDDQHNAEERTVVSSVVDIAVYSFEEAMEIEKMLVAAMNSKADSLGRATMHTQYLEYESKLRVTLWGTVFFMQKMFELLVVATEKR